ncbi:MAG: ABC transporter ATP-binding protein [bacterium]|nr:ABC transporter ATP-binding protein [bacterium]
MIEIRDLHKRFGDKPVLGGVDLDIPDGEALVIAGRSGCGKTVLLKSIIGLIRPDRGRIRIDGEDITVMGRRELYRVRMKFGMLFQGAALFDSMTVEENVGLPLREHTRMSWPAIRRKVEEKLDLVGLPGIGGKKPAELSGGMRKRVGLARALMRDPSIVLYDEPTTGLDPLTSVKINDLIAEMNDRLHITSIAVTHDMLSAFKIGKRIAMLHEGRVAFDGSVREFRRSADPMVRRFLEYQRDGI